MNKRNFLSKLSDKLSNLPHSEAQERLNFYSEMIDDLVEEGLTEEQAVLKVGNADDIAREIVTDVPFNDIVEEKLILDNNANKGWQLALLIASAPIWFSILIAIFSVAISLIATLLAVSISLWAVPISLIACAVTGVIYCFILIFSGYALTGFAVLGAGLLCAGLSILFVYVCNALTKFLFCICKKIYIKIKEIIKRRVAK